MVGRSRRASSRTTPLKRPPHRCTEGMLSGAPAVDIRCTDNPRSVHLRPGRLRRRRFLVTPPGAARARATASDNGVDEPGPLHDPLRWASPPQKRASNGPGQRPCGPPLPPDTRDEPSERFVVTVHRIAGSPKSLVRSRIGRHRHPNSRAMWPPVVFTSPDTAVEPHRPSAGSPRDETGWTDRTGTVHRIRNAAPWNRPPETAR